MTFFTKTQWRMWVMAVLLAANAFIWYVVWREDRRGILTLTVLDVGQGDAIFIDAPSGNQMLIDAGPPDDAVVSSLGRGMPFYDRSIDLVALSHPHLDHYGGLPSVFERFRVDGFVTSGTVTDTPDFSQFERVVERASLVPIPLVAGTRIDLGLGAVLEVLAPQIVLPAASPHEGMLVMRLVYGDTSVFLTGDMERPLERYLVAGQGKQGLHSNVLKVGHHGSYTSSDELFLAAVDATYGVISVGAHNRYGHPKQVTLDTLERFKLTTYRTDQNGSVRVTSDGRVVKVSPESGGP